MRPIANPSPSPLPQPWPEKLALSPALVLTLTLTLTLTPNPYPYPYRKALNIRVAKLASDAAGLAQAYVSLGNNLVIAQEPAEKQLERCQEGLTLLEKALHHYQAAFQSP